ncbi:SPASM domain-containing protein [Candidatus Sordicultor fermentans]|uniref:SPASM domain-containing protein n=1 Tax=Candidatus Sordicultor fermentans TaxID=1953203 RepID=UPI003908AD97
MAEDLSPREREEVLEFLYQCLMGKRIFVFSTTPQFGRKCLEKDPEGVIVTSHYSVSEGRLARVVAEYVGGCGAGRAYCALQPDGVITPCVFMPIALGNIIEQPFFQIWRESLVLKELRDRTLYWGHCGECDYQLVCGGCRARAYAYFKDYLAPDAGCKFNQEFWEEIEKEETYLANF